MERFKELLAEKLIDKDKEQIRIAAQNCGLTIVDLISHDAYILLLWKRGAYNGWSLYEGPSVLCRTNCCGNRAHLPFDIRIWLGAIVGPSLHRGMHFIPEAELALMAAKAESYIFGYRTLGKFARGTIVPYELAVECLKGITHTDDDVVYLADKISENVSNMDWYCNLS